ncbi:MAG: hypothetical protein QXN56_04775 [Candidatus Hadarchaeum sp.]
MFKSSALMNLVRSGREGKGMRFFLALCVGVSVVVSWSIGNLAESGQSQSPPAAAGQPAATQQAVQEKQTPSQSTQGAATGSPAAPSSAKSEGEDTFRPRLPMYYAKVVDEKQRQRIYDIQRKYYPKISELQKQLDQLIAQRNAEIEAVLTPEQKAQIEKLRQEAAARRAGKAATDEDAASSQSSRE